MDHHFAFIKNLVENGGPTDDQYADLNSWILEIAQQISSNSIPQYRLSELLGLFGDAFSLETMQGFAFQKPHGYAGDFEIIDRIYKKYVSDAPHLKNWDIFWHSHAAANAVRNRVIYFSNVVAEVVQKTQRSIKVLNLASGPGHDMLYFLSSHPEFEPLVHFECVEQDEKAIKFAAKLCDSYLDRITFVQKNALRFESESRYDLIWSAGLFDYFDNKVFIFMLSRLKKMMAPDGSLVVGNFCATNPSRAYMQLFQWHLHHRSPNTLKWLASKAGFQVEKMDVRREPSGVNLFLHAEL